MSEFQEVRERLECVQSGRSLPATYEGRSPREGLSADLAVVFAVLDQAREALGPFSRMDWPRNAETDILEVSRFNVLPMQRATKSGLHVKDFRLAAQVYQTLGGTP